MSGMMAMMASNVQRRTGARLVYDLDAANFTALPTNGAIVNGFPLIVTNPTGTLALASDNGKSFYKSYDGGSDYISGGPNYVTGQSYTVFMAYKLIYLGGRLLNTADSSVKDWFMGSYVNNPRAFYPNINVNLPEPAHVYYDTLWHLDFATWDTSTYTGSLYTSTSSAPNESVNFWRSTNSFGGGFNGLRLFNGPGQQTQTGNIAFDKVYDGVLTLPEIQGLHATHKARFGY